MGKHQVEMTGVFATLTTPFDQQGNLDLGNLAKNVQSTNHHDLKAIVVLSKIGEPAYLSCEEKCKVVQTTRQNMKEGCPLIAGAGRQGTRLTIDMCNRLADSGADAVLVHPPNFYSNMMHPQALNNHYRQVADHSKVPVIIYNIPHRTGIDMDAATIVSLASHNNIIGVSDGSENTNKVREIVNATKNQNFKVMAGMATCFADYMGAGATCCLSALACILPGELNQIFQFCITNKQNEALQMQHKFSTMSQMLKRCGPACMKHLMDKKGQHGGMPRSPMQPLTNEEKQCVENDFRNAGFQI